MSPMAAHGQEILAAVIEHTPVGIIVVDRHGQMVLMNDVGRRITGVPPSSELAVEEQTDDYVLREPITDRHLDPEETPIARAVRGEVVEGYEYVFQNGIEHRDVWVRASAVPLRDRQGQPDGAVAVFVDVTRERLLERQRDSLLSAAAHDLKSPLTSISGFTQLLRRTLQGDRPADPARVQQYLDRIEATTGRMSALITELLDTTVLQMNQPLQLATRPTDLVVLLQRVVSEEQAKTDHHQLVVHGTVERLVGQWDTDRLERVFANLLSNAVKYSPDDGSIMVTIGREDPWAVVTVEDRGIGIPAADLPHIFERFWRGGNVSGEIAGTGIGLAGVKHIVDQHGGRVEVESRVGEGSRFTVWLPLGESSPR
jgi:PAS domain S-box-containing protein